MINRLGLIRSESGILLVLVIVFGGTDRLAAQLPEEIGLPPEIIFEPTAGGFTAADVNEAYEELLRGPIHEGYAEQFDTAPSVGVIVDRAPPAPIPEIPPEIRPDDQQVEWLPGYWFWDDDRDDYIWISGSWRAIPPGVTWIPGYWAELPDGRHQWIGGTWVASEQDQLDYIAESPPASLELGPVGTAPSVNHFWVPGCWQWNTGSYGWRPGYWSVGYSNWVWVPARYRWTPRGYLFCPGYWDYPFESRGTLFSPVWFHQPYLTRSSFFYTPRLVLRPSVLRSHLWLRPGFCHYYFGDFYAVNYRQRGIYPWFGIHTGSVMVSGRRGYDPLFEHYSRFSGVGNTTIVNQMNVQFNQFVNLPNLRPPRTYSEQVNRLGTYHSINSNRVSVSQNDVLVLAEPLRDLSRREPTRFRSISTEQMAQIRSAAGRIPELSSTRRTMETVAQDRFPASNSSGPAARQSTSSSEAVRSILERGRAAAERGSARPELGRSIVEQRSKHEDSAVVGASAEVKKESVPNPFRSANNSRIGESGTRPQRTATGPTRAADGYPRSTADSRVAGNPLRVEASRDAIMATGNGIGNRATERNGGSRPLPSDNAKLPTANPASPSTSPWRPPAARGGVSGADGSSRPNISSESGRPSSLPNVTLGDRPATGRSGPSVQQRLPTSQTPTPSVTASPSPRSPGSAPYPGKSPGYDGGASAPYPSRSSAPSDRTINTPVPGIKSNPTASGINAQPTPSRIAPSSRSGSIPSTRSGPSSASANSPAPSARLGSGASTSSARSNSSSMRQALDASRRSANSSPSISGPSASGSIPSTRSGPSSASANSPAPSARLGSGASTSSARSNSSSMRQALDASRRSANSSPSASGPSASGPARGSSPNSGPPRSGSSNSSRGPSRTGGR
jgi:hypothetical protein